jgi:hypothetical protein
MSEESCACIRKELIELDHIVCNNNIDFINEDKQICVSREILGNQELAKD